MMITDMSISKNVKSKSICLCRTPQQMGLLLPVSIHKKQLITSSKFILLILACFGTCIIHKLTASCLRLSFHLTFKFLVLQTNNQFFPFFFFKCKTKIQSGRSHADYSTLKSGDLTTKSSCVSLSIWTF